jgi:CBS domain-containing protein
MNSVVSDFMRISPLYVYENDNLLKVLEFMKKFNVDEISVVDEEDSLLSHLSKKNIEDFLKKNSPFWGSIINSLKNKKVSDVMKRNSLPIIFYPTTNAEVAFSLMEYTKNKYVPVVETPWGKKIVGFLWLNDKITK